MILADTSVWINHLREGRSRLTDALNDDLVLIHPFVVGELACGNLRNRGEVLALLGELPAAPVATDAEALQFIEGRRLMGIGLRYVDVHLLASATLSTSARLWTLDRRLAEVAAKLKVGYS